MEIFYYKKHHLCKRWICRHGLAALALALMLLAAAAPPGAAAPVVAIVAESGPEATSGPEPAGVPSGFVQAEGPHLVISGSDETFCLKGVNLTNNYYAESWESIVLNPGHDESDYKRVRDMGLNCVRLNLNGALLEDPARPGFVRSDAWTMLDNNIRWARNKGIYVILDMHVPLGGDWLDSSNPQPDFSLWEDRQFRSRFISIWKEIAGRYRDEKTVAAYDLLNEPVTSDATGAAWKELAAECTRAVRTVDPNHLLIVERVYGCNGEFELPEGDSGQFLVDDPNVLYDFHFYEPFLYTHQGASWAGLEDYDGGRYPDATLAIIPEEAEWDMMIEDNPCLPEGDSSWTYYTGTLFRPGGSGVLIGSPVLCAGECQGEAWFDSLEIKEYDENRQYLRSLRTDRLDGDGSWSPYSADDSGRFTVDSSSGRTDGEALAIAATSEDANYNNSSLAFPVDNSHYYQVNGWMKGRDINESAWCCLSLEFYRLPAGNTVMLRDRRYLESCLNSWTTFGRQHQVPVSMMEFGLMRGCFQDSRGGAQWMGDILDIANRQGLSWACWAYHDDDMGIYASAIDQPIREADCNQTLVDLFHQ